MRILVLHNRYREPGGEDAVVRNETDLLRERGHDVDVLILENPEGARATLPVIAKAVGNRGSAQLVSDRITTFRPDVVHLHNWWFQMSPSVVAAIRAAGVPLVATAHNHRLGCVAGTYFREGAICTDCLGGSVWRGVAHSCYRGSRAASGALAATLQIHRRRGTWDGVDRWLALTDFHRDLLLQAGLDPDRVQVKPNFAPDPGERVTAPSSSRDVVVVGRLVPEKGVGVLLEAWRRASVPGQLHIVGDGPERDALSSSASDTVKFWGQRSADEVRRQLLGARALLFPVQWLEPFGMVLVEAMAAGLPVMASRLGATGDVVGGEAGWLADGHDVEAWTAALASLENDQDVDRRGLAARERWREAFTSNVVGDQLEAIYLDVLDEAAATRRRK